MAPGSVIGRIRLGIWLIPAIALSIAAIVFVSYSAVTEWRRNATAVAERRGEATVNLLVTALQQDMRAVQVTVLSDRLPRMTEDSADRYDLIASALARYPYPEAFFTWSDKAPNAPVFYSRSDRWPPWLPKDEISSRFPISLVMESDVGPQLLRRISKDVGAARRYSVFDVDVDRAPHQVVALLSYDDPFRRHLSSVFGFLVDLTWVRRHYLTDVANQVARMSGDGGFPVTLIEKGSGGVSPESRQSTPGHIPGRRDFPLLFFDPRLVAVDWPDDLHREYWTASARISDDPAVRAADIGARRTLIVAAVMAVVMAAGIMMLVRMTRATAQIAEIRSEFVSTVTHELKTPLATIQAISETFASGRGMTPEISRNYGRLAVHEVKRLRRLIENLLAYSRVADVANIYSFEPVDVRALVDQALQEFASQLEYGRFEVCADVPTSLPPIRADRRAMSFALGNLIENAIRYSPDQRYLGIRARTGELGVLLEVSDRGIGIAADELPFVTRKFFTGRRGHQNGSGLGLAIVERIVSDHGGSLQIASQPDKGTTVTLDLRIAEAA